MFWKILFWLVFVGVGALTVGTAFLPHEAATLTWGEAISVHLGFVSLALFLGYLYSLGWKKKLYSRKANNWIFGIFLLSMFTSVGMVIYWELQEYNSGVFAIEMLRDGVDPTMIPALFAFSLFIIVLIQLVFVWTLPFVAYLVYRFKGGKYEVVEKPYWKIFAGALIYECIFGSLYTAVSSHGFQGFSALDLICMISIPFQILYAIGYAFDKKIFSQITWKIITPIFVVLDVLSYTCASDAMKAVVPEMQSVPYMTFTVILELVTIYMLYRYAFTDDVYKIEEVQTEPTVEEND